MALEQMHVVDYIGIDKETGHAVVTLGDELDWEDEQQHLYLLQVKINAYLAFIESGELCNVYPQAEGRKVEIQIVAQYEYPELGREFLASAHQVVTAAGFGFSSRVLGLA